MEIQEELKELESKENLLLDKSFAFALRIVRLRKYLISDAPHKEYDISKQLLRSGTSIGANAEEAQGAQSTTDFIAKLSIAYKEARESRYWVRLLEGAGYLDSAMGSSLLTDIDELCKILSRILLTSKSRLQKGGY